MDFTANWGWPQWTIVLLTVLNLAVFSFSHGEPRKPYNAFVGFLDAAVMLFILIAGGFFA